MIETLVLGALVASVVAAVLGVVLLLRVPSAEKLERALRDEIRLGREEAALTSRATREENAAAGAALREEVTRAVAGVRDGVDQRLRDLQTSNEKRLEE